MNYNGVSFNENWAKTKTVEEFIAHEGHHGLTDKQLKEAYYLMCPKVKKSAEAKEIVETQLGSE